MEARYIEKDGVKYYAVGHSESTVHVPGEGPATTVSEILKHVPTFEDTSIVLEGDQPAINPDILQGINEAKNLANEAIAEAGSNSDGHYIKLPSGIQIVYRSGIVMGAGERDISRTFPQEFSDANSILILPVTSANAAQYAFEDEIRLKRDSVTTTGCTFFGKRNNFQFGWMDYIAIGRWK